jgi:hypothetical protein
MASLDWATVLGMRMSPKRLLPALAVAAAGLIAGCGGGSGTTAAGNSSTTSSPPATATVTKTATAPPATTTASATASATASGASTCRTSQLRLSFVSGNGAAGTSYTTYGLTNAGSSSCVMFGYPGVAILDGTGHIVQHPARRGTAGPTIPVRLVTLPPGARATFLVNSTDVIPSPGCQQAYHGATLQVFPPNQRAALRLPDTGPFCDLRVGPVQRG